MVELWRLMRKNLKEKAEISVSGVLAKYMYKAGETTMTKTNNYKSWYMFYIFKTRNMNINTELF